MVLPTCKDRAVPRSTNFHQASPSFANFPRKQFNAAFIIYQSFKAKVTAAQCRYAQEIVEHPGVQLSCNSFTQFGQVAVAVQPVHSFQHILSLLVSCCRCGCLFTVAQAFEARDIPQTFLGTGRVSQSPLVGYFLFPFPSPLYEVPFCLHPPPLKKKYPLSSAYAKERM